MATVLCILFPDPTTGYAPSYARDAMPTIEAADLGLPSFPYSGDPS
ncbi:MAG: hypothetical protein AAAB20_10945 [Rhizobium sp.]|jgi:formate dehydrogenase